MQLQVIKKIGNQEYPFTVEGANLFECLMESKKLSFQGVSKCGLCDSDWLYLTAYETKEGYKYAKVCCVKCNGSVTFGQPQKSPDTFYLRKNEDGKLKWEADDRTEKKAPVRKPNLPEGFGLKEVDVDTDAPF